MLKKSEEVNVQLVQKLIQKESGRFKNKFWLFILAVGPFFLFSISGLIGKAIGFSWMQTIVHNNLMVPVGIMLMMYALITATIIVKKSLEDKRSAIHLIPYPKIWAPVVIWISIATGVLLFITSVYETLVDIWPETVTWYPSGWIYLGYLIGFLGPLPTTIIFNPSFLKKILSCKRNNH